MDVYVSKQENMHYKYYCNNDKACDYIINFNLRVLCDLNDINFNDLLPLVVKYVGNNLNLMDSNLIPSSNPLGDFLILSETNENITYYLFVSAYIRVCLLFFLLVLCLCLCLFVIFA